MKQGEILILDLSPTKLCSWLSNGLSHHRLDMIVMEMAMRTFPVIQILLG